MNELKETRRYSKLKEEALVRLFWGDGFGRNCGPVIKQTKNEIMN